MIFEFQYLHIMTGICKILVELTIIQANDEQIQTEQTVNIFALLFSIKEAKGNHSRNINKKIFRISSQK